MTVSKTQATKDRQEAAKKKRETKAKERKECAEARLEKEDNTTKKKTPKRNGPNNKKVSRKNYCPGDNNKIQEIQMTDTEDDINPQETSNSQIKTTPQPSPSKKSDATQTVDNSDQSTYKDRQNRFSRLLENKSSSSEDTPS